VGAALAAYMLTRHSDDSTADPGPVGTGNVLVPEPPEPAPEPPKDEYFIETFEDGAAENWDFPTGRWRVLTDGERALTAVAGAEEAVAVHKLYARSDCGVSARVRMEADDGEATGGRAVIALSVRRDPEREIVLRLEAGENSYSAWLRALVGGRAVRQSDAFVFPRVAGAPLEATLRIDVVGNAAAAMINDWTVGVLRGLPDEMDVPGAVALRSARCSVVWDDVALDRPDEGNLLRKVSVLAPIPPPEPKLPPITEATAGRGTSAVSLQDYTLRVNQSFQSGESAWQAATGAWVRSPEGRYGLSAAARSTSFFALGAFTDIEVAGKVVPGEVLGDSEGKRLGLLARHEDADNHIFFGLVGMGGNQWTLRLEASTKGRTEAVEVRGGPFGLDGDELELKLAAVGDKACGFLNGRPMVSLESLWVVAPTSGRTGIVADGVPVSFDDLSVRVRQSVKAEGPAWHGPAGAVGLDVPEDVEVEGAAPPDAILLKECSYRYVFLRDLVVRDCSMSVLVQFDDLESYPAFSLCGAAQGQRDVMVVALLEFDSYGRGHMRLSGTLLIDGKLKSGQYQAKESQRVDLSKPVEISIALQGDDLQCAVGGDRLTHHGTAASFPSEPGQWGFRSTGVSATIKRIDVQL